MIELKAGPVHDLTIEEDGSVHVAFAQTDAVDLDQDYTFAGAFPDGKSAPMSAFGHNSWGPEKGRQSLLPVGIGQVKERAGWAVYDGRFLIETTHGRDTYLTVKALGPSQQWSYGYDVLEKAAPPPGVKARRGLKRLDVHEISPVLLGAQPNAHTMAIKSLDLSTDLGLLEAADDAADYLAALKQSPLAGLPFTEMSDRLLIDVEAFKSRTAAIHEMRLKEGRAISSKRIELLNGHVSQLLAAAATLREMVDAATPVKPPEPGDSEQGAAQSKARRARAALAIAEADLVFPNLRTDN